MGTFTGANLIDELSFRLRDPTNVAYPRVVSLNILNRVQSAVNIRLGLVHGSATFTTTTSAFYSIAAIAADIAYPVQLFDESQRELDQIDFDRLTQQDPKWSRLRGIRPEVYATLGREGLIVTPIPRRATTLTLRYVKHPTTLTDGAPAWDLPDEHRSLVTDLSEALLMLRARDFAAIQETLTRVTPKFGIEDIVASLRKQTVGEHLT